MYVAKYVDDMTMIETVRHDVDTDIRNDASIPHHTFEPTLSASAFNIIKNKAESKGLKINDAKTQLLSVSSGNYTTEAFLKMDTGEKITSDNELKMLGFSFSTKPNVGLQVENIIKKANKRFFVLLRYKRAGLPTSRLKDVYTSVMRSCLEYCSPVYHPQLAQYQIDLLEKIQKRCLRMIYGYDKEYQELLNISGLSSLEERRTSQFGKFANSTVKNPKYHHWFPPNNSLRKGRHTLKYLEETSKGNRLYKSPLFAMRRYLNQSEDYIDVDLAELFHIP